MSCVSLWLAVGLLVVPAVFRWRKTGWLPVLAAVAAGIFLLTLPALAGIHTRMRLGFDLRLRLARSRTSTPRSPAAD